MAHYTDKQIQRLTARLRIDYENPRLEHGKITYCYRYTGKLNEKGYGRMKFGSRSVYVHRAVMEMKLGRQLACTEIVQHKCDTPDCANEEHLELGTLHTNAQDMYAKQRHGNHKRTRRKRLTPDQVAFIKFARGKIGSWTLADKFGVSPQAVRDIWNNKTWKTVIAKKPPKSQMYDPHKDE